MSAPLPSHSRAKDAQSQFLDLVFCNQEKPGAHLNMCVARGLLPEPLHVPGRFTCASRDAS